MKILILLCTSFMLINGQTLPKDSCEGLARHLANVSTREETVEKIAANPGSCMPILMKWSEAAPAGIDYEDLAVGLAETFGRLRYADAVPFLIRNIDITRFGMTPSYMKTSASLRRARPAADALIQIGEAAREGVMRAVSGRATPDDRVMLIFVLSQIGGGEVRQFLRVMRGYAAAEKMFCEVGLGELKEGTH